MSAPLIKALPAEYVTLAETISLELKASREHYQNDDIVDNIEALESYHSKVTPSEAVDQELTLLVSQAKPAMQEMVLRFHRLKDFPEPSNLYTQALLSVLGSVYTGYTGDPAGLEASVGSLSKSASFMGNLREEIQGIWRSYAEIDSCRLILPRIASRYAATPSAADDQIKLDLDEAWGPLERFDWLSLQNAGSINLSNCTIQVDVVGANGDSRRNVHFAKAWPAGTALHARYKRSTEGLKLLFGIPDDAFRTSVPQIQKVAVTIWSPEYSTTLEYVYQGDERDRDIAFRYRELTFSGHFEPFVDGYLWDVQPGVEFTMIGMDILPPHYARATFRFREHLEAVVLQHDEWRGGEAKTFRTSPGQLTYLPSHIDLEIAFPGSAYRYRTSLEVPIP